MSFVSKIDGLEAIAKLVAKVRTMQYFSIQTEREREFFIDLNKKGLRLRDWYTISYTTKSTHLFGYFESTRIKSNQIRRLKSFFASETKRNVRGCGCGCIHTEVVGWLP